MFQVMRFRYKDIDKLLVRKKIEEIPIFNIRNDRRDISTDPTGIKRVKLHAY